MGVTYHIAVDLGATSGRVILASFSGTKVTFKEISRFKYPMLPVGGCLFWNLPQIFLEVKTAIDSVIRDFARKEKLVSSIGIDTWGCDVAFFYKDGSLAGLPYCYRNSFTAGATARFAGEMPPEELYSRTGIQFLDFNTLFQLYCLRSLKPKLLQAADHILFMPDALIYMLTGEVVTEFTVASTSQMLNINTGEFDSDLLAILGLDRHRFGRIVQPGEVAGTYRGVPVVAVASHDTASAVAGIPTPDSKYAYLSCGTWALLGVELPQPKVGPKAFRYNFTNEGGINGTTRLLKNICGMWIFERIRSEFGQDDTDINLLAALCHDSDLDTLINPDDPVFSNPESMSEAIRIYCESNSLAAPKNLADYIRVIYRSLAHRVAEVMGLLREVSREPVERLHVIGGGSRNSHLMKMLADETGLTIVAGPPECTALGNVLVQLSSLNPDVDIRDIAIKSTETITYNPQR